ncbi:MAG: hypothetical protein WC293_06635 [Candidatus Omnitrophota bacterium]|jgi:hypothetical protein
MAQIPFEDCQGCVNTLVCVEDDYSTKRATPPGEHCKFMVKQSTVYFGKNPRISRADIMKDETKPTFEGNRVKQSTKDHDKVSLQFPGIGEGGRPDGTTSDSMRLDNIQRIPEVRISAGYVSDLITYEEHPLSSSEEKDRRYKNDL